MVQPKKEVGLVIRRSPAWRTSGVFRVLRAIGLGFVVTAGLTRCAPVPVETDIERLDVNTGTTVTVMGRPVEFVVERVRGAGTDPFAYLAPFETNRMGTRDLFLWISAPQIADTRSVPELYCGEERIRLEPISPDVSAIGLSQPPYELPAPWSTQWYFRLPGEVLDCLASASRVQIVTRAGEREPDRFIAEAPALAALGEFVDRLRSH